MWPYDVAMFLIELMGASTADQKGALTLFALVVWFVVVVGLPGVGVCMLMDRKEKQKNV